VCAFLLNVSTSHFSFQLSAFQRFVSTSQLLCYIIAITVLINQLVAFEPDKRPKRTIKKTIAFNRDQRDRELSLGITSARPPPLLEPQSAAGTPLMPRQSNNASSNNIRRRPPTDLSSFAAILAPVTVHIRSRFGAPASAKATARQASWGRNAALRSRTLI
jgi:hypothetical protein